MKANKGGFDEYHKSFPFTVCNGPFSVDISVKEFNLYYISVEKYFFKLIK